MEHRCLFILLLTNNSIVLLFIEDVLGVMCKLYVIKTEIKETLNYDESNLESHHHHNTIVFNMRRE